MYLTLKSFAMSSQTRREALKLLVAGSGIILLSPDSLFAAASAKKDRLGVALVGLGYYSTDLLAPALLQTKHCYLAVLLPEPHPRQKPGRRSIIYPIRTSTIISSLIVSPITPISM